MQSSLKDVGSFLTLLQSRERTLAPPDQGSGSDTLPSLIFANALVRYQVLRQEFWSLPPQLMVIGPTQSGKSTIVNLLLGADLAHASPLAGHTRYAQGFATGGMGPGADDCLQRLLSDWQRVETEDEVRGQGDIFSVIPAASAQSFSGREMLIWDTPDFDSVGSRRYRNSVPEICALSDLILLVVSREKYADRSVWQILRLIAPLDIPLLICLNKTLPEEEPELVNSLEQRLRTESISCAGILSIPFASAVDGPLAETDAVRVMRERVGTLLPEMVVPRQSTLLQGYLTRHWAEWVAPVKIELTAAGRWRSLVEEALEDAQGIYQRDYLDNPHYSDTLQRAIAELLRLLEIPGIAATLTHVRAVLTWPARKVHEMFKQRWKQNDSNGKEMELRILQEAVSHLVIRLQHQASEQLPEQDDPSFAWWSGLLRQFESESPEIRETAGQAVNLYIAGFEVEIREAGERLYQHLEAHPATLNGLRAARVTTDAAAVVIAVKTGGIGVNDLILTPAMLSFTSLLAEGAVGSYMKQIEKELRERQLTLVKERLFDGVLRKRMLGLVDNITCDRCYRIPPELLQRAETAIEESTLE